MDINISKFYSSRDFACPCGLCSIDGRQLNVYFLGLLDKVTEQYGKRLEITRGLVCHFWNYQNEGHEDSYHLLRNGGCAVHVKVTNGIERFKIARIALAQHLSVGVAKDFLHLDGRRFVSRSPSILFPH